MCLILDQAALTRDPDEVVSQALSAGVRHVQYRNKHGSRREIYETSSRLIQKVRRASGLFIVNDHADIAAAVDADGVHLGQDDLPIETARKILGREKLIGISTHNREEALAAESAGADYIGFGPVFKTATKDAGKVQGTEGLVMIRQTVKIPVVAIGGINSVNVRDVIMSGATSAAVISAILSAPDIKRAAEQMVALMQNR